MDDIENKMNDLITEIDKITELGDFSKCFKLNEEYNNDDVKKMITEKVKGLIKKGVRKAQFIETINQILNCKDETTIVGLLECLKTTNSLFFRDNKLKKKLENIKKESIEEYEIIKEQREKVKLENAENLKVIDDIISSLDLNNRELIKYLEELKILINENENYTLNNEQRSVFGNTDSSLKSQINQYNESVEIVNNIYKTYKNSDTEGGKRRKSRRNRKSKKGKKSRKARKSRRKSKSRR